MCRFFLSVKFVTFLLSLLAGGKQIFGQRKIRKKYSALGVTGPIAELSNSLEHGQGDPGLNFSVGRLKMLTITFGDSG